jgi:hypothetical protein
MHADNSQLLAQLRDIHAAADPGWWPPAPGWWVLALLLSLSLFFTARLLARKLATRKRRVRLLTALDALKREFDPVQDAHGYLSGLNRLFRAVALRAFPGTPCASLQGEEWVRFIVSLLPEKSESSSLATLACGPYEPGPEFDAGALDEHARAWVRLYG